MKKIISIIAAVLLFSGVSVSAQIATDTNQSGAYIAEAYGKQLLNQFMEIIERYRIVAMEEECYEEEYYEEEYYEDEYYEDDCEEFLPEEEDGDSFGTATVCVEAFTVGGGYIIAPTEVDIYEDVNCAYLIDELFAKYGLMYTNTGSFDGGFYLSSVEELPEFTPQISEKLTQALEEAGFAVDAEYYTPCRLSEFDFTQGSGWMYSVNGEFPNVGFSEYCLQDGDVMRIQFTLAYGSDVGDSSRLGINIAEGIFELPDRDALTKAIAAAGIENCSEYMEVITDHDITQAELDSVLENLQ